MCIRDRLHLFAVCISGAPDTERTVLTVDEPLASVIDWTEAHYAQKISLEDAAKVVHLSKNYFCRYFRKKTGMTYLELSLIHI